VQAVQTLALMQLAQFAPQAAHTVLVVAPQGVTTNSPTEQPVQATQAVLVVGPQAAIWYVPAPQAEQAAQTVLAVAPQAAA
jgi:hypothetical protein